MRPLVGLLALALLAGAPVHAQEPESDGSAVGDEPGALPAPLVQQFRGLERTAAELEARDAPGSERADAHGTLGHLYFYYDLHDRAAAAYERAATAAPDNFRWQYHLGVVAANRGDGPEATTFFRQAALLSPEDPQVRLPIYVRLGQLALDQGDPSGAETSYRAALAFDGDSAAAWYGLGRAQLAAGDPERAAEAVTSFEKALAGDPEAEAVRYSLAQAYRLAGRVEEARAEIERLAPDWAARRPEFPDPLMASVGRATALSSYGLVMALAADPEALGDLQFYRFALGTLGNVGGAGQGITRAVMSWPPDKRSRDARTLGRLSYLLGGLELEAGRPEGALERFAGALVFYPDLRPARVERGLLLRRMDRHGEALAELERAFEGPGDPAEDADPLLVEGRLALASYRLAAGDAAASVPLFEAVVAAWPVDPRGPVGLAEALARLDRRDEAAAVLRAALERVHDAAGRAVLEGRLAELS